MNSFGLLPAVSTIWIPLSMMTLQVLRVRRRRDRRQDREVHAERLIGHGAAARDLLPQILGCRLRECREDAEPARVGDCRGEFGRADPLHAALNDRIFDFEKFGDLVRIAAADVPRSRSTEYTQMAAKTYDATISRVACAANVALTLCRVVRKSAGTCVRPTFIARSSPPCRSRQQIVSRFDADRQTQQTVRNACRAARLRSIDACVMLAGMRDQALDTAQRLRQRETTQPVDERAHAARSALQLEAQHCTESALLCAPQRVLRM